MSEESEEIKKVRKVRPIYVMLPKDGLYEVHQCVGLEEVREVLGKAGIADEVKLAEVVLVRGDKIPLKVQVQTKLQFGNR